MTQADATNRALQMIEAVMHTPPSEDDLANRLLAEVVRLTEDNRTLRRIKDELARRLEERDAEIARLRQN